MTTTERENLSFYLARVIVVVIIVGKVCVHLMGEEGTMSLRDITSLVKMF